MRIELHNSLKDPEKRKATRLVVYDDYGNAIATFLQIDQHNIDVRVKGQPGFEEALRFLGIQQTVITDVVTKDTLRPIQV